MLMVIFGAGASYDSAPSRPPRMQRDLERPPLAEELFADIDAFSEVASRFPRCLPIIPRLRDRPAGVSVEQALEQLQQEAEGYPEGYRQLAAIRFYLNVIALGMCRALERSDKKSNELPAAPRPDKSRI